MPQINADLKLFSLLKSDYKLGLKTNAAWKTPQQARQVTNPHETTGKLTLEPDEATGKLTLESDEATGKMYNRT